MDAAATLLSVTAVLVNERVTREEQQLLTLWRTWPRARRQAFMRFMIATLENDRSDAASGESRAGYPDSSG